MSRQEIDRRLMLGPYKEICVDWGDDGVVTLGKEQGGPWHPRYDTMGALLFLISNAGDCAFTSESIRKVIL